jgi:anti-sigma28 factor (negative regulator of flagellin synthesis)
MFIANVTRTLGVLLMVSLLGLPGTVQAEEQGQVNTVAEPNAAAATQATPAAAASQRDQNVPTSDRLVAVRNLRCEALDRAKAATIRANIRAGEMSAARNPVARITVERQLQAEQSAASSVYEEAAMLRRSLTRMVERYTTALQQNLESIEDADQKTRLENRIEEGQAILDRSCNED